jgi:hypothetical protein
MQTLAIPETNNGIEWNRLTLEECVRSQLGPNKELGRYLVESCGLEERFFYSTPYIILIHWFLDLVMDTAKKTKNIKIDKVCKIGLFSPRKDDNDKYKIAGWDATKYDNNLTFLDTFIKKLAKYINDKNAMFPTEYEGIDIEKLKRYCNGEVVIENVNKVKKGPKKATDIDVNAFEELKLEVATLKTKLNALESLLMNN